MDKSKAEEKVRELISGTETEIVEFKEAKENFHFDRLGECFSGLSNEANLRNDDAAWLIFGVSDQRKIVGTNYRPENKSLHSIKNGIAKETNGNITFREIYDLKLPEGRVILFEIPSAQPGIPTAFKGHAYAREGDSLIALSEEKRKRFYSQTALDWSAKIIENATLDDLDPKALKKAREDYKIKNTKYATEIDQWDDLTLLNKAKITIHGKITNTALLLLGKDESAHFLSPYVAHIAWILYNEKKEQLDYEHFHIPFVLTTDTVLTKIRNLNYRYMPEDTLFPLEMPAYNTDVIREALHNCIAHQDYSLRQRILVLEHPDYLVFENAGSFIPGSVENVIKRDSPDKFYRNDFLCKAMVNLNMIDTIGSGIRKMFTIQRKRYFPLPDYDLTKSNEVKVKIYGSILNKAYTEILLKRGDLDLELVMALDKVQKHVAIEDAMARKLKAMSLIDGRKPNYLVSFHLADDAQKRVEYLKNKAFDDAYYKDMIIEYLRKAKQAKRAELDSLLLDKLPDILSADQKKNKVTNLIQALKAQNKIKKAYGSKKGALWVIA